MMHRYLHHLTGHDRQPGINCTGCANLRIGYDRKRGSKEELIRYRFSVMSCKSNLAMYPFRIFAFWGRAAGLDADWD